MTKARAETEGQSTANARGLPKSRAGFVPPENTPAVILVEPQLGENIGFAARAMANFGLARLRLVAPRDGWPSDRARAAAAGADAIIDAVTVHATVEQAVADLNFLLATTARPRDMVKPVLTLEGAAGELAARAAKGERIGILFGQERSGLDNDAISLADAIVTAPVNPDFASLSLPQTVLLVCYEWRRAHSDQPTLGRATSCDGPAVEGLDLHGTRPATRAELFGLFAHLEDELDRSGFLRAAEKRPTMVRSIRNMFHRMGTTEQDVRTWRGIISSLSGGNTRKRNDKGS
jgi:tRNA/rRNA methyltransferase